MKNSLICLILLFYGSILWAQENPMANAPPDNLVQRYLSETKEFAILYTGKTMVPYDRPFANHPYFESNVYTKGTICYNRVVYPDVYMRLDLYRDELSVVFAEKPYHVVPEKEKFDYAILNGSTFVLSVSENDPNTKFLMLLQNGKYPVVRKYKLTIYEDLKSGTRFAVRTFKAQIQYAVYVNGVPYTVKSKKSVLKLFADRKKELNEFAKQHKLDFRQQPEQSIIALVNYYEMLTQ